MCGRLVGNSSPFASHPAVVRSSAVVIRLLLTDTRRTKCRLCNIDAMGLRVRSALTDGFPRAFRRNGWILIGAYLLISLLQGGLVWMVSTTVLPLGSFSAPVAGGQVPNPGAQLPPLVSVQAVLIASFAGGFLTVPVLVVANRALVSQFTDRIPEEFVFHRLGWATLNSFVGTWLVSIVVGGLTVVLFGLAGWGLLRVADQATLVYLIGTWPGRALLVGACLVLLVPGTFLGMSLIFVGQEVAVKDENVIGAIFGSWRLTRRNRLRLLALALLPFVFQMIFSLAVFQFLSPIPAQILSVLEASIVQLVVMAIMARAYVQVSDEELGRTRLYQKVR